MATWGREARETDIMALVLFVSRLSMFLFLVHSHPLRMRGHSCLSVTPLLDGVLVRVAPVGTVGALLFPLHSRGTDSRCLGFYGNIHSLSPLKLTRFYKKEGKPNLTSLQTCHILQPNRKAIGVSGEPKWILHRRTQPLDFSF